jgi:ribosomal protein L2
MVVEKEEHLLVERPLTPWGKPALGMKTRKKKKS